MEHFEAGRFGEDNVEDLTIYTIRYLFDVQAAQLRKSHFARLVMTEDQSGT
jgi:hypothetical protein